MLCGAGVARIHALYGGERQPTLSREYSGKQPSSRDGIAQTGTGQKSLTFPERQLVETTHDQAIANIVGRVAPLRSEIIGVLRNGNRIHLARSIINGMSP